MTMITGKLVDLYIKGKIENLKKEFMKIFVTMLIVILPINLFIPVYASNVMINGKETEEDYIKLAKFLSLDYDKVYAYNLSDYSFFGVVITDYIKIADKINVEINTQSEKVIVILSKDFRGEISGADKVDIGTKYIEVYKGKENAKLIINPSY